MKATRYIAKGTSVALLALAMLFNQSCTKFDDEVYAQYTEVPNFMAITGPVYTSARGFFGDYFDMQTAGADEVVIPTRGGDWFDGGKWRAMHYHSWDASHVTLTGAWNWGFNAIGTCNQVISIIEGTEDSDEKITTLAELKTMRAWYYYLMMDTFGNIPLVTAFDESAAAPSTSSRAEIYAFIESELLANLDNLNEDKSEVTYGRPTKWMAHTLLAKLYLNAQVYTGTAQWNKVVEQANAVIGSGQYALDANFLAQFAPTNGAGDSEPIFSLPFDPVRATGNQLFMKVLHYALRDTYGLNVNPWNGWCTQPSYFDLFEDDDIRKEQWVYGQQYNAAGQPLVFNGVNIVLDPYGFELLPGSDFDIGGDDAKGRLAGARSLKYSVDPAQVSGHAGNDVVIYRLADVYLMKAEAILRGASNGTIGEAVAAANEVRQRAFPTDPSKTFTAGTLNLNAIYAERGREFTFEVTRRTDMIRFGRWEDALLFKPANPGEAYKRIFPIPNTAIATNGNLTQNPQY
ncbi:RagB/SusD family nutrient uptake outer membrane protein [Olivibacter sitiensis]|uniref:RagB/SusD family nutrient uptake outer membrane protein n=1 Tax=Olivibacter sitiensis TaxID=376470 RepID=UPI000685647C|nr:RagB/SusD family nutrient uptake outer membrane protein [Olivibacter sitiensis]